jgi:phage protein D/phage baseplate assembly protein gpV
VDERYPVAAVPDRPELGVAVGGRELEPLVLRDIAEVDVHEEVNRHSALTMLVQNWDPDRQRVRYSDDGPFAPGRTIAVRLGYHAELSPVFGGVITGAVCHFAASHGPTLEVVARSRSVQLAHPIRSRAFEETTDGEVARAIGAAYGLRADAATGAAHPNVVQDRRADWEQLVERAEALGWVTYVRDDELVFRPPAASTGDEPELRWGANLTELHLAEDVSRLADGVTTSGWDPESQASDTADADAARSAVPADRRSTSSAAAEAIDWPHRSATVTTPVARTAEELDLLAVGWANRQALGHISGYGTTIGLPVLRSDSWVQIANVGSRVGGLHYVTAVRHRYGPGGFRTEFRVGSAPRLAPPARRSAAAGLSVGVVSELDDPLGWGRVKVTFPWRADAQEPIWARVVTLDAGPAQGTWFIPDIGQEVVVAHLDGDPAHPVVLGSLWNGRQGPPVDIDPDVNGIRAIVTRSGHRLEFDDGEGQAVRLTTAGGHRAVLDDANGTVRLEEAGAGNHVELAADGVTIAAARGDVRIEAAAGSVKISGTGFEATSTGPAKVESSATLELKAAATLGIRGALVNVN